MSIQWTNKSLRFLHHEYIVEYDIKSANTSLMRYYNLMPLADIEKISAMAKEDREITVGKLMRSSPTFAKGLESAFSMIIEEFLKENHLDKETDVISIKKDAVFVRNRSVKKTTFGDSVVFRAKGEYTGFFQIPSKEFYYQKSGKFDVKGISNELLPLHVNGVLDFMLGVFQEASHSIELQKYLKEYASCYKKLELPFAAYRQFDGNSKFLVHLMGQDVLMDNIDDSLLRYLDVTYNYLNVYLEVLKVIIGK